MSAECCAWIFVVLLSLAIILWILSDIFKSSSRSKGSGSYLGDVKLYTLEEDWGDVLKELEE